MIKKKSQWAAWSALCLALMLMMIGVAFSFGIIERKLVLTGPFNSESNLAASQALIIDLRSDLLLRKLLSTGCDSSNNPRASALRLFMNGQEIKLPHNLHESIRSEGRGAFSHWKNHLIFSLISSYCLCAHDSYGSYVHSACIRFVGSCFTLG